MAKTDLLKEAIADAKAVRETALANAKIALEEAFTPRIQSMLSAKLAEEEEMEAEAPVAEEEMEEPVATEGRGKMNDADEDPTDMHSEGEHGEETMDEEEMEEPVSEEGRGEDTMEEEEDLELEAIIKELEDETMEEDMDSSEIGSGDNKVDLDASSTDDPGEGDLTEEEEKMEEEEEKMEEEEEVSLDEIINALREEEGHEEPVSEEGRGEKEMDEEEETKKDLEEAYKVIRFMKSKLNEVNLLNAKLLFSNKLFRNHSLNESQKMKVIENFDRAQSLREVKLVFATLTESFNLGGKTKRTIKESYASKPSRSTRPSKKVISEGNDLASRWKKLANL